MVREFIQTWPLGLIATVSGVVLTSSILRQIKPISFLKVFFVTWVAAFIAAAVGRGVFQLLDVPDHIVRGTGMTLIPLILCIWLAGRLFLLEPWEGTRPILLFLASLLPGRLGRIGALNDRRPNPAPNYGEHQTREQLDWRGMVLFLLVILAVPLAAPLIGQLSRYADSQARDDVNAKDAANISTPSIPADQEILTLINIQDSEGITQRNFDLNFLKLLEASAVEGTIAKTKNILSSQGYQTENLNLNLRSEAVYMISGPMKLAVVRIHVPHAFRAVLVYGVVGNELRTVLCTRPSEKIILLSYGACAAPIKEAFGVTLDISENR